MIKADQWEPADGLVLEPNAYKAAKEIKKSLALTAGPGAGKTEMLAQRADFLLQTGTCFYPKRVLAISFKVDASKNLKERVQKRCGFELSTRFDSYTFHGFAKRIIDRFRPILTGYDELDRGYTIGDSRIIKKQVTFSDLVPLAVEILEQSSIARNALRQTYSDVFLDEFQDCTDQQYKLIKIAFWGTKIRMTAVGDTKQKIMGWAGAMEGIFKTFADDFDTLNLNLYMNFRSRPRLLQMQNNIITVLDPESTMAKDLIIGEDGEIEHRTFQDSYEEAEYISHLLKNWIDVEKIPLHEIAVLVSKQIDQYAFHLMNALEILEIPFRNEQSLQDITNEPLVRLIVDYLSCYYSKREPKAWERLINQLEPYANYENDNSIQTSFFDFLNKHRTDAFVDSAVSDWWEQANYFLRYLGDEAIISLSADYESTARREELLLSLKNRIDEILKIEPNLPKALERFATDQAVSILTIHKSKGLEFDSVIIMAVENEIFFGNPADERCAFFVGVSRAKSRLVLTSTEFRERPAGYKRRWDEQRSIHEEFVSYVL